MGLRYDERISDKIILLCNMHKNYKNVLTKSDNYVIFKFPFKGGAIHSGGKAVNNRGKINPSELYPAGFILAITDFERSFSNGF